MISVNDFLKNATPKRCSKLLPFKDDIFTLKEADLSNQKICEFLKLNGVDVSHQRVATFLREQGFNKNRQWPCPQIDSKVSPGVGESRKSENKSFIYKTVSTESEFAKPSWVPMHINIEDLK